MKSRAFVPGLCLALGAIGVLSTACSKTSSGPGGQVDGLPVENRPPNAKGQTPAFAGQTRVPFRSTDMRFEVQVVASGLSHPWSLAFLPDGAMLVTERPGRMRVVDQVGALSAPITGLPGVHVDGQGGLLDVVVDPQFADNQRIYWSYSELRQGGNGTAVASGRLVRDGAPRLDDVAVIWHMTPNLDSSQHFGGRLVFARDGALFVTTGDRSILPGRRQAQQLDSALGKVIRIQPDGMIPQDNPFVDNPDALPEIWSSGHRNMQGAALHPDTGELWVVDHGARGGDEINAVERGKNYGWPTITYGIEYSGDKIGDGITSRDGMEQPLYFWDPVIAPSGMAFYTGTAFPAWTGNLFVGALAGRHLVRLTLDGKRITAEERLLVDRGRIRDVRMGPDGALYVVTDEDDGEILRLVPEEAASLGPDTGT
jgi:glucose/arabinose dehydrogenase